MSKIYTCTQCGKRLKQRRKTAMCKACLFRSMQQETDERIFAALVEYKRQHDGNTPKVDQLAKLAFSNSWSVDQALYRLEQAGRIRVMQSKGGLRQDGIIVEGAQWVYQEGNDRDQL